MSTQPKRTGSQKPRARAKKVGSTANRSTDSTPLLADLRDLILTARRGVARVVDSGLVVLSWQIGQRIRRDILQEKRAEYGKAIVVSLVRQLSWTH